MMMMVAATTTTTTTSASSVVLTTGHKVAAGVANVAKVVSVVGDDHYVGRRALEADWGAGRGERRRNVSGVAVAAVR